ncbi:unnamed protein product [Allacma fusca]|uniref:Fatty acid desaturase domain-containing protein n=1 Tax=Allacma fusca TaxID=39272 RepID=A0A8J2JNZ4_9HEXA|nr:unnamed protein product [Allacma fusca]
MTRKDENGNPVTFSKTLEWASPVPVEVEHQPYDPEAHGYQQIKGAPPPPPLEKPPFTLKEIRDSIPPHCFERSIPRAFFYTVINIVQCAALFYIAWAFEGLPRVFTLIFWPIYWLLQGATFFGIGVIGHECGHEAYSKYVRLNHTVGFVLHTFILIPYFNWRTGHLKHHKGTGSVEHDEVHSLITRSRVKILWMKMIDASRLYTLIEIVGFLTVGVPMYLIFNYSGPQKYKGKVADHFSPSSVLFLPKQRMEIIMSDLACLSWIFVLMYLGWEYSFSRVMYYYVIPLTVHNCFSVLLTFLQHTDTYVPHYRGEDWSWLRGTLCTVDRSYGKLLDVMFHHLADTHVCHHLFPRIPFYHAQEATEAVKTVLGKYYMWDETPVLQALWRVYRHCKFVEDEGPVAFYKTKLQDSKDLDD